MHDVQVLLDSVARHDVYAPPPLLLLLEHAKARPHADRATADRILLMDMAVLLSPEGRSSSAP